MLVLASLGKQYLDHYLAFLWDFSSSKPVDFLSSIPSLLSVFPVCGPSWGSYRRHTEKEPRSGLGCTSQCTFNMHLSLSCTQRKTQQERNLEFWITLSYRWGNWGPERYGDFTEILTPLCSRVATQTWIQVFVSKSTRNPWLNFRRHLIKISSFLVKIKIPDRHFPPLLQNFTSVYSPIYRLGNPFSGVSSWPRDWTQVSCIAGGFFTVWATREALFSFIICNNFWWSYLGFLYKSWHPKIASVFFFPFQFGHLFSFFLSNCSG